jgi:uncharacterized protein (TIGR02270 family)
MVIQDVVSQHAEEAAFLWSQRSRAVADPAYTLRSLEALDERIEAHLDALRIAGDAGWALCRARLENSEGGEVFPLAILAFGAGHRERMLDALTVGCVSASSRHGLISALGFLDYRTVEPWVGRLLEAKAPMHRAVGVAACAIQRVDPGGALAAAANDGDPAVRSRALRAVGELKRRDLLNDVRARLGDDNEECRFWAAWTLTLYRDPAGLNVLTKWLGREDRLGCEALRLSLRAMTTDEGREWIRRLANDPARRRAAVIGAGVLGDPATVAWLIGNMRTRALSRLAGEAFSMITGVDLAYHDLAQTTFGGEGEPEEEADDTADDAVLPWPHPQRIAEWWQSRQADFQERTRYLAGHPVSADAARRVLLYGQQRQRAAGALELALREPDDVLFEVRARGSQQRRQLDVPAWA